MILHDVLVVLEYGVNLLSVHKLARDSKFFIGFDENKCYVQALQHKNQMGRTYVTGDVLDGLYFFGDSNCSSSVECNSIGSCYLSKFSWHNRPGHPAEPVMEILKTKLNFDKNETITPCEICHKAKQIREPFPLSEHKSNNLGELVHFYVWGPYRIVSKEGYRYFLTIVDDFTKAVYFC